MGTREQPSANKFCTSAALQRFSYVRTGYEWFVTTDDRRPTTATTVPKYDYEYGKKIFIEPLAARNFAVQRMFGFIMSYVPLLLRTFFLSANEQLRYSTYARGKDKNKMAGQLAV
jgi:hypothetical protein